MFHVKSCKYRICSNCFFMDDLTNIYIIKMKIKKIKLFDDCFLRALEELEEQQKNTDQELKKGLLIWNGGN